jgi:hypothetical protein
MLLLEETQQIEILRSVYLNLFDALGLALLAASSRSLVFVSAV